MTPKKLAPPQLAKSRPGHGLKAIELAMAIHAPDLDPAGYPQLCQDLLDNPECIAAPEWRRVIIKVLKQHIIDHPLPTPSSPNIAYLVNLRMLSGDMTLADVRAEVAAAVGKSVAAVEKAHRRFKA